MFTVVGLFFFFSSRRRHTRFDCDWSSDVCSSDLEQVHLAYRFDAVRSERGRAEDRIRQLEIEVATLRSPSRIEARARALGLVAAGRDQIRLAKEYVAGGTGFAADRSRAASLRAPRPPAP